MFDEKSLTARVILSEKPLFLDSGKLNKLMEKGLIVGSLPKIWLGVPLITNEVVIGVLAIQNYKDPNAYTRRDLDILISVSHQIAVAIERKRIHQALIENEKRYRTERLRNLFGNRTLYFIFIFVAFKTMSRHAPSERLTFFLCMNQRIPSASGSTN